MIWQPLYRRKNGVATSQWGQSGEGSSSSKVVNATQFFEKLGVGNFMVNLITINCEGGDPYFNDNAFSWN
jgi:hypothetical protein